MAKKIRTIDGITITEFAIKHKMLRSTVEGRYNRHGDDAAKILATPMSRSQSGRMGRKASSWDGDDRLELGNTPQPNIHA
jgi:hypothetical protein